ncbi:MAG TPA: alpha/beta fold hydrolase [Longimicrobiaceae bacterium]|nr:alpha/beta fold hydrolase [Longimicrobiaceae bacterium]
MQTYIRTPSLLAAASLLLGGAAGAHGQAPRLALEPCSLPGVERPARCGTLEVPEDRAAPSGRRIGLRVAVIPAESATPAPDAVFVIAGGPGQPATAVAGQVLPPLAAVQRERDVVLVDQRGTGASNALTCGGGSWTRNARRAAPGAEAAQLRECREELEARADLRMYGTPAAVADLEAVRAALGYERVNLFGISYGTRVAQEYLRRHPERTRSVLMRAVAPVGFNIPLEGSLAAQAALDRVLADCAADAACSAAYPRLPAELDSVFARAERDPAPVHLRDPASGDTVTLPLTRDLLSQTLYTLLLGSTTRQMIPQLVHGTAERGPEALAPVLSQVVPAVYGPIPRGMYLSVVCSEDAPRITPADAGREDGTFLREAAGITAACAGWPRAALPADFHEPFRSDVPVLMVSGGADPATPPAMGERARRYLRNSLHVVVPAAAHGPVLPGCAQELAARFIAAGSHRGLSTECAAEVRWRPFAVPAAAAAPRSPVPYAEAPLTEDSGRILVPVRIAGRDSLVFILDTAAGGSVISPATRDLLGLDPAAGESVQVMGASGPTRLPRLALPPVTVGGETVEGMHAVVTDVARFRRSEGPPYAGVLGVDFLRAFDVEIDVPGRRLRLWRLREGAAPPAPPRAPATLANLASVPGFVAFDVAVGDTVARAILDSGAHLSTLNWRAAAGAGVTRATPGLVASRAAGGISGDTIESHRWRFDEVGVEGLRFPPLEMRISDLPVFRAVGFGDRPAMLVGADLMRTCRVFISYSTRRVHLCGDAAA